MYFGKKTFLWWGGGRGKGGGGEGGRGEGRGEGGRGGEGSQFILMHKGGVFMLVANNVMVGVPCTIDVGIVIVSGSSPLLGTNVK